jgi:hypothetical protein
LAAVIERVGTIADIDAANVGGEGFERVEGSGFSEDSERVEWVAGSGSGAV